MDLPLALPTRRRVLALPTRRRVLAVALTAATALALTGCATGAPASSGRIEVVAGEDFWGSVAQQVGGDRVRVTSIIDDPDEDPHEYESDARDAAAVSSARLVVQNGLGYDDFLSKLLDAQPRDDRAVLSVARVLGAESDANPHLWYDTAAMPRVAAAIAAQLGRIDRAHAAEFTANARRFDASLTPIEDVISTIRSKYAGTPVAYTERVPGYLVTAAGLRLGTPAGFTAAVERGEDPSPADDEAFQRSIRSRAVKVLLYNAQVTDAQTARIQQLAASAGVPVVGVTETIPPTDQDYQSWQLRQVKALLAALGG